MSIAVVTDSTSDVPLTLAQKLNITVVPAIVIIEGQSFEDGQGLTRQEFYTRLPNMEQLPTTASPSAGTFENTYRQLLDQGFEAIISIHVASRLSAIYNTANLAAQPFSDNHLVCTCCSLIISDC